MTTVVAFSSTSSISPRLKNSLANDLLSDEKAKTYFDGTDWIIIYNDKNDIKKGTC